MQFFGIFDARSVFHATGNIDQFGVEFFTNCKNVFGIYTARKPERQVARLLQEQRFGDGLSGTAEDSLHLCIKQDAGFAVPAEGSDVIEILGSTNAGSCVTRERFGKLTDLRRINSVELDGIENAILR